jgi:hypothetical protein
MWIERGQGNRRERELGEGICTIQNGDPHRIEVAVFSFRTHEDGGSFALN